MLDMEATSLEQIADLILDNMANSGSLTIESKDKVRAIVLIRREPKPHFLFLFVSHFLGDRLGPIHFSWNLLSNFLSRKFSSRIAHNRP